MMSLCGRFSFNGGLKLDFWQRNILKLTLFHLTKVVVNAVRLCSGFTYYSVIGEAGIFI